MEVWKTSLLNMSNVYTLDIWKKNEKKLMN